MPSELTYIGGPTILIQFAGMRFLTDPTFDPAGQDYPTPVYTLHKLQSPALSADSIGPIDTVLTFTAEEGVQAAKAFPEATIVPVHFEGWAHFSEAKTDIDAAFLKAGLEQRLRWLTPGQPTQMD